MNISINPSPRWDDFESRISLASLGASDVAHISRSNRAGEIFTSNGIRYQIMFNGLLVRADGYYGSWVTRLISSLRGFHEPQEEKVFHVVIEELDEPRSMIELGAYWGWYSLWFKWRHPEAISVVTEPNPKHLEVAAHNAWANSLEVSFELGGIAPAGLRTNQECSPFFQAPGATSTAPALDVEEVMKKHGIANLSILHADIQGAELHLLRQVANLLKTQRIDHLFISTHWQALHNQCREFLVSLGYNFVAEHTPAESYTIDGLLVARSPSLPTLRVDMDRRRKVFPLTIDP